MKRVVIILVCVFSVIFSQAQDKDITGQWNGVLSIQGVNLRLVFHIKKATEGYTSTMDSPDQGAVGIPVATTKFEDSKLSLAVPNIGLSYEGEFKTDSIVGTFKQGTLAVPMTLKRSPTETKSASNADTEQFNLTRFDLRVFARFD
jgi:hypothetical protein